MEPCIHLSVCNEDKCYTGSVYYNNDIFQNWHLYLFDDIARFSIAALLAQLLLLCNFHNICFKAFLVRTIYFLGGGGCVRNERTTSTPPPSLYAIVSQCGRSGFVHTAAGLPLADLCILVWSSWQSSVFLRQGFFPAALQE